MLTGVSTYVFGDLICCVIFAVVRPNIGCGAGSLFFVCVWFGFVLVVFVLLFGVVCLVEYFGLTIQRPGFLNTLPIMATTLTATIVMMSAAWPKKRGTRTFHANLQSKSRPGAFYTRKRNFLRRGRRERHVHFT